MQSSRTASMLLSSVFLLSSGILVTGCKQNPEEKKAEIRNDAQREIAEVRKDERKDLNKVNEKEIENSKDAFASSADKRIDALGDRLDKVEKSAKDKGQAVQDALAPSIATARGKREAAKAQLKSLKDADANTWLPLRANVDSAIGELDAAVQTSEQGLLAH